MTCGGGISYAERGIAYFLQHHGSRLPYWWLWLVCHLKTIVWWARRQVVWNALQCICYIDVVCHRTCSVHIYREFSLALFFSIGRITEIIGVFICLWLILIWWFCDSSRMDHRGFADTIKWVLSLGVCLHLSPFSAIEFSFFVIPAVIAYWLLPLFCFCRIFASRHWRNCVLLRYFLCPCTRVFFTLIVMLFLL